MALRVFTDEDGQEWNVWPVRPSMGDASPLHARFRDGWICFQRLDGAERCRIPLDEAPAGWESLSDQRLDLLRRVAEQPTERSMRPATGEEPRHAEAEDEQRDGVSGPHAVAGSRRED